jgi:hypothetical protein
MASKTISMPEVQGTRVRRSCLLVVVEIEQTPQETKAIFLLQNIDVHEIGKLADESANVLFKLQRICSRRSPSSVVRELRFQFLQSRPWVVGRRDNAAITPVFERVPRLRSHRRFRCRIGDQASSGRTPFSESTAACTNRVLVSLEWNIRPVRLDEILVQVESNSEGSSKPLPASSPRIHPPA